MTVRSRRTRSGVAFAAASFAMSCVLSCAAWAQDSWAETAASPSQAISPQTKSPQITSQPRDIETASFWGVDVKNAFPEWKAKLISLFEVFEGRDGSLIARLLIGDRSGHAVQLWDVDLLRLRKKPAPKNPGSKGNYLEPAGGPYRAIKAIDTGETKAELGALRLAGAMRNRGEMCFDPITTGYRLERYQNHEQGGAGWSAIKSLLIIMRSHSASGEQIGGYCGENHYEKLARLVDYAGTRGTGGTFFELSDHTALVPANNFGGAFLILRIGTDLSLRFHSPAFITMDKQTLETMLASKGHLGTQKQLLEMFK